MERKESYKNGHSSDYSEDFEEDVESEVLVTKPAAVMQTDTPQVQQTSWTTPRNTKGRLLQRKQITKGAAIKTRAMLDLKRVSKLTPYRMYDQSPAGSSPRNRLLSSKKRAIKTLQNELADTKRELEDMKKENRLLNRLQARQERELDKVHRKEGELPQILLRHAEEVRALKEQHRRSHEAACSSQQKVNDLHQELLRLSGYKKKLEEVVKRKHLLEREALTIELQEANDRIEEKNRRIAELERGVEVSAKTHAQEVRTLLQKNRALSVEAEALRNTTKRIQTQLREKEKEMYVMNIYSQRIKNMPPQGRPAAVDSAESQTDISCLPHKMVSLETRPQVRAAASQTDLETTQQQQPAKGIASGTQTDITMVHSETSQNVTGQPLLLEGGVDTMKKQSFPAGAGSQVRETPTTSASKAKSPSSYKEKPTLPTDTAVPGEANKEVAGTEEEQHKKAILLAKLRAMDSQKGPPSSRPIPPGSSLATKSPAVHTERADHLTRQDPPTTTVASKLQGSTVTRAPPPPGTVASKLQGSTVTKAPPLGTVASKLQGSTVTKAPSTSTVASKPLQLQLETPQSPGESESQRKKKMLLAKLMAIDNKSGPTDVAQKASTAESRSNTSLQSWPDKVENMHRGRPAYSTEDDPLGSKHSLTARKSKGGETFITETEGDMRPQVPRFGRRQQNIPNQKCDDLIREKSGNLESKGQPYKPSFGRRAAVDKPKNEFVFGGMSELTESRKAGEYPWETRINVSSDPGHSLPQGGTSQSPGVQRFGTLESRSLLPLRPKAEPVMNSFDVMPGTLATEPDDIEELVL